MFQLVPSNNHVTLHCTLVDISFVTCYLGSVLIEQVNNEQFVSCLLKASDNMTKQFWKQ